ncbi:MAG: TIR domain-containing protein [Chloroflexota bacterium]|nr:TIR domain-containing protein [Chloroflexota bacterium]MDE2891491.1 TIR domain-containing protein [Chloroflexota bacterium]MDE2893073.1 TIR domain-containing protein [Chloroflexota bacterium]
MDQYEVALSFAGAQRDYVEQVARILQARGVAVFYDEFEKVALWGTDGTEILHEIYSERASYVVMFVSKDYVAGDWPQHEKRAALSRAIRERREFILPVRFDDSVVPGMPSTTIYQSAVKAGPAKIAEMVCDKLGVKPYARKADAVPPPRMTSQTGEAAFDYSSHNGRYAIGCGSWEFETAWSKASGTSIHLYNDPSSINGVALAKGRQSIGEVTNAAALDYTSRSRTTPSGGVAVLRNTNGFYAALQVLDIKDDTLADDYDELRFRYAIQVDGSDDFGAFAESEPRD